MARARRAEELAAARPVVRDVLTFYAALATAQDALLDAHPDAVRPSAVFRDAVDLDAAAAAFPALLEAIVRSAPLRLASAASDFAQAKASDRVGILRRFWRTRDAPDAVEAFLAEALLQPFAEGAAATVEVSSHAHDSDARSCVVCAGKPVVAVLREEGQGAKRSLVCGLCLTEWGASRIACAACGESQFDKLAVFQAVEVPGARIDACERCRSYIKTIDLSKDGTAVPVVDDLGTLTLDVWAREQGYTRIRPNLLRI